MLRDRQFEMRYWSKVQNTPFVQCSVRGCIFWGLIAARHEAIWTFLGGNLVPKWQNVAQDINEEHLNDKIVWKHSLFRIQSKTYYQTSKQQTSILMSQALFLPSPHVQRGCKDPPREMVVNHATIVWSVRCTERCMFKCEHQNISSGKLDCHWV